VLFEIHTLLKLEGKRRSFTLQGKPALFKNRVRQKRGRKGKKKNQDIGSAVVWRKEPTLITLKGEGEGTKS